MFKSSAYIKVYGVTFLFVLSCSKDPSYIYEERMSSAITPQYFPIPVYEFSKNTYSKQGFELGKKLFFDPILSNDSTISCSSCHIQVHAFSDSPNTLSKGVGNLLGDRNSPAIFNLRWHTSFMWDGGINHLEIMPFAPITNTHEMGEDMILVLQKLNNSSVYKDQFYNIFQKSPIDAQQFFYVLAQYIGNLVSYQSKYDRVIQGQESFNELELKGYALFKTHCNTCHQEPLFTNYRFYNNGIDSVFTDPGRFRITLDSNDLGKFKVPTLRNIQFTKPYMHNGSIFTLEEVLQHYSQGIIFSPTLAQELITPTKNGFQFSQEEIKQLMQFLNTLSDYSFISDQALLEN